MSHTNPCQPRYQDGSLVNLLSSVLSGLGGAPEPAYPPLPELAPERIAGYRNVILLVVDGLGDRFLRDRCAATWLNRHRMQAITSVFPSTTASAITTYLTGQAPQQHALTGWHMYLRELAAVMTVLPGRARYGGVSYRSAGVDVNRLFGHRSVFERVPLKSFMVTPARIADSDFNRAHCGPATVLAYATLEELTRCIEKSIRGWFRGKQRRFVYAYWPDLDSCGHRYGMHSAQARDLLLDLDRALADLAERLAGSDTLLLVCADHGQIDCPPERNLDLADHPEMARLLALPLCGEPRVAYAYVRAHCSADFEAYVDQCLGHCVELRPSEELLDSGWFGLGTPHPELARRIGDYTLLLKEDFTLREWLPQETPYRQIGTHGGATVGEMLVPLIAAEF